MATRTFYAALVFHSVNCLLLQRPVGISRARPRLLHPVHSQRDASFLELISASVVDTVDDALFSSSYSEAANPNKRERVVVLGSGWGAYAFVAAIDCERYDVCVVSPRNYFLFTPMLAGAATGTVEPRSICQPIRSANPKCDYLEAQATLVDIDKRQLSCQGVVCEGVSCELKDYNITFDHLVCAVGATSATFGIPGVAEHTCSLRSIDDAVKLRRAIGNCFERANAPGMSREEISTALTFVVVGAGPTGVEFCGELVDLIEGDITRYFPNLIEFVSIKLVEASSTILAAFDDALQQKAMEALRGKVVGGRKLVEVLLKAGVSKIQKGKISLTDGGELPYGLAVWAAGNAPLPFVLALTKAIPGQEPHQGQARGRLAVDPWLRVHGTTSVWALGDCAYCLALPATAQVASQQGGYLARLFSRNYDLSKKAPTLIGGKVGLGQNIAWGDASKSAPSFRFLNLGILAYLGNSEALAQVQLDKTVIKGSGASGFALWRSVYLSKQVSWRNRVLVAIDWVKVRLFGRDITTL